MSFRALRWDELTTDELYAILVARQQVFVVEQACAYLDADGADPVAVHLLATDELGLWGYLRLFAPDASGCARIGRVLTVARARGSGRGRPLMEAGREEVERRYGVVPVRLSAQAHLEPFYASLGYAVDGPGYLEDGIPHVPMIRRP
ncbi:MAG: GNAT family N-acetyltransferase [Alphaproteobacteria bacterium]|nr:GNAT family N-acetyltransferase [Alphaproteobacteria bacterium]